MDPFPPFTTLDRDTTFVHSDHISSSSTSTKQQHQAMHTGILLSVEQVFSWKNETLRTSSLQADATLDGVKYEATLRNQMKRTAAGRTEGREYPNWRGEWGINNLCRDEWFFLFFSSKTRICLKRLQKKATPSTYLIFLPATIHNDVYRESLEFCRIFSILCETRRHALLTTNNNAPWPTRLFPANSLPPRLLEPRPVTFSSDFFETILETTYGMY